MTGSFHYMLRWLKEQAVWHKINECDLLNVRSYQLSGIICWRQENTTKKILQCQGDSGTHNTSPS